MGVGNTVMIFGLGDLGGWVLEFLARRLGVSTIIACDKREDWGKRKTEGAAMSSGTEGYYKTIKFEKCDVLATDVTAELIDKYNPDLIYTSMTLMSWTVPASLPEEIHEEVKKIAGPIMSLQVALLYSLMQAVKKSGTDAICINNSWPDIVNPMLCRSGFNVLVGAGNLDLIVAEIKRNISVWENVPMSDVTVYLFCEHVLNVRHPKLGIPYYLKVMINDKDITSRYDTDSLVFMTQTPHEWVSWCAHPLVASSAVRNIMAILNDTNEFTHAPGPNGLIGGYPLRISGKGVEIELPEGITMEQAIKINVDGAKFEGVEEIKSDGTLVVTDEAYKITKELLGLEIRAVRPADSLEQAKEVVAAFKKLADKYKVREFVPSYTE